MCGKQDFRTAGRMGFCARDSCDDDYDDDDDSDMRQGANLHTAALYSWTFSFPTGQILGVCTHGLGTIDICPSSVATHDSLLRLLFPFL